MAITLLYSLIEMKLELLILMVFFLCSCAAPQEEKSVSADNAANDGMVEEAPTREALYVYNNNAIETSPEIILSLNSRPLLLAAGYIRLVGVVSGGKPIALLEVAGKGLCVGVGEKIENYKVVSIGEGEVKLEKEK